MSNEPAREAFQRKRAEKAEAEVEQLRKIETAVRDFIARSEEAEDNYDSPVYADFEAAVNEARERLRAALGETEAE